MTNHGNRGKRRANPLPSTVRRARQLAGMNQAQAVPSFEREYALSALLLKCHEFLYARVADHKTIEGRRATVLINEIRTLL